MAELDSGTEIDIKLNTNFPGKVVRKDLTKLMKVGHNVPVYVLEYLLGSNCATDDEELIKEGVKKVKKYDKLLGGGIWCIIKMEYSTESSPSPFVISSLKPIQIPNVNINDFIEKRKSFTKDEWIDVLIRTIGMEPTQLEYPVKWHLLERLVPLVENNYNMVELGPRSTGKSHVYKEISPNTILISGGQTTVANLFYNMSTRQVGLVGMWDVVAFDEVAGIRFKDKDGIQNTSLTDLDL